MSTSGAIVTIPAASAAAPLPVAAAASVGVAAGFPHPDHVHAYGPDTARLSAANTFANTNTFSPANAAGVAAIDKGLAAQAGDLRQWQNSAGTVLTKIDNGGRVGVGGSIISGAALSVATGQWGDVPGLIVREAGGQTVDPITLQSSAGAALLAATAAGLLKWSAAANQQTTVGAAGAASALPGLPTKYLKVVDSAGTTLVVPAYNP